MKVLIFAVLALLAVTAAYRDLSKLKPKHLTVAPKKIFPFRPRIVGGQEAKPHQFPYQVALIIDGNTFCGGSIIDTDVVLTAAHCVESATAIEVIAGAHNISKEEITQQSVVSNRFIIHPEWDNWKLINDIALIILPDRLIFNDVVQPIALYKENKTLEDVHATVSGWGRPSDNTGAISDVLRFVSNNIISKERCERYYEKLPPSVICLSGNEGRGACNGDSGGPLASIQNGRIEEIGIVSYGIIFGCEIQFPSVFTRISWFYEWIEDNIPSKA